MDRLAIQRMRRVRNRVLGSSVHYFTEKAQLPSISVGPGTSTPGFVSYKLSDLGNLGSFRNLFDLYKIKAVKLTLIPLFNSSQTTDLNTVSQAGTLPMLYVAPNRDPYVPAPTGVADILNDDGCKIIRLSKPTSFYIKSPKPDLRSGDGSQVLPIQLNVGRDMWLTTGGNAQTVDQSAIGHFGHRFFLTNNATSEIVVQVYVKYYLEFKEQD